MPWLVDDMYMKDPQSLPGLSLVQWMNMQQNPSLSNSLQQPNYLQSLSGSSLQNLGFSAPTQIPQQNSLQFSNTQKPTQQPQLDQLQNLPAAATSNPLGSFVQQPQQLSDISQNANLVNQNLPSTQVQAQILQSQVQNILHQQQPSIQSHQINRNVPHNLQQQIIGQNQQQNLMQSQPPDQINQQPQMLDNQMHLQLLQKLQQQQQQHQQQQAFIDQQRPFLDQSQSFSRSATPTQSLDMPQAVSTSISQSHLIAQQTKNNSPQNLRFSQPSQQPKLPDFPGHAPKSNQLATGGSSLLTGAAGGGQSGITDDVPSCSTSPSTNNCMNFVNPTINGRAQRTTGKGEEMIQCSTTLLSASSGMETMSTSNANIGKDLQQKPDIKPSLNISKSQTQNQGFFSQQMYLNSSGTQMDYLDASSSATSVCLSQNDLHLQQQNNNPMSFNQQSILFKDTIRDVEVQGDQRNSNPFVGTMDSQLGMPMIPDTYTKGIGGSVKDFSNNLSSGVLKDAQAENSSSIVSQSFGVPDMAFNSLDSPINDNSFLNTGAWAPPPTQFQRMRTFTKVLHRRFAVGTILSFCFY